MPSGHDATMVEYINKQDGYWLNVTYIKVQVLLSASRYELSAAYSTKRNGNQVGFYTYRDIDTLYLFAENNTGWVEDEFYYDTAPADWGTIQVKIQ